MNAGNIFHYFPDLDIIQREQVVKLEPLYREWNARINVISRQDVENLYERHVLHSLAIAKIIRFAPGARVMDAGTGGGFPGVPLAIFFPEVHFHLVDSTAKKLTVVKHIADGIGLQNVTTEHCRLEAHKGKYDFVVSRAVAPLAEMAALTGKNIKAGGRHDQPNGLLYLKGGDVTEELRSMEAFSSKIYPLKDYFSEAFFETKLLVHLF